MIFWARGGSRRGSAKIKKNVDFCPFPMASIGKSETLRFSLNSANVFGELFSKRRFSEKLVQIRSTFVVSGTNFGGFLRDAEGCLGMCEAI